MADSFSRLSLVSFTKTVSLYPAEVDGVKDDSREMFCDEDFDFEVGVHGVIPPLREDVEQRVGERLEHHRQPLAVVRHVPSRGGDSFLIKSTA